RRLVAIGLLRCPEPAQRTSIRALAQLLERALPNLADALARHSHQGADLLERHRLGTFLETVVEVQDLALARREVAAEHAVDELPHELVVGALFDLLAVDSGEALTQRGGFPVGS